MALSVSRDVPRYVDQELRTLPVRGGEVIYRGALLGYERNSGTLRGLIAGDLFAGVAYEECDNLDGADGERSCRVYTQGDFQHAVTGTTAASRGRPVFATSEDTLTLTPGTSGSYVGKCVDHLGGGECIVRIEPLAIAQAIHHVGTALLSLTSAATTNPVMIVPRPIVVLSAQVVFNSKPDAGLLDVGYTNSDPDEIVDAFNLTLLTNHSPSTLTVVDPAVPAGSRIWAKVSQATSTPGVGGLLTLRYIELP